MPFPPGGDCPYASILSTKNKFYTHFNSWFCEFDPVQRAFTFHAKTTPQMAMGMTEDDNGVIWSVTYPDSGVVSFNPETREFKDYGRVHEENWRQYQRTVAADDTGWVYFGNGNTRSQIIAFDPTTGLATSMCPEEDRGTGTASVFRGVDGKVYGQPLTGKKDNWYMLYRGVATKVDTSEVPAAKPIITSSQGLFHRKFPSGKILAVCDTVEKVMKVTDPATGESREMAFEYSSEGAHVMGLCAAPDGSIAGGTAFPMRFFRYDPAADEWTNRASYGQWNTVVRQGDRFFVGGYGGGFLLEWDPTQEWVPTVKGKEGCNPQFITDCSPPIHRPHELLAHPDGKTIVLAGTPGYGYTGGGLLFYDRETREHVLVEHTDIIPQLSTMSLVALPEGKLLGGTTTSPGTGGEKLASQAEMYIMDMESKGIEWREVLFPGAQNYTDMCPGPRGLIYGVVDSRIFFVFDPAQRKVIHQQNMSATLGSTNGQQGPRVFVTGPDGTIYMLFVKGIAVVDPATFEVDLIAQSPVPIGPGGDILDGRIYFASGSHMYSYEVPATQ